jgi:DNA-binding NarL/FixJ family response regulator
MKSSPDAITQQIRVLLADDHPVVRQGLAAIFDWQKDIKIVGKATVVNQKHYFAIIGAASDVG